MALETTVQRTKILEKDERFLSIDEASDFLNLKKATIYAKTCKRLIPHYKVSKKIFFRLSELINWLESGRRLTEAELELKALKHLEIKNI